jgi:hypothetical protein
MKQPVQTIQKNSDDYNPSCAGLALAAALFQRGSSISGDLIKTSRVLHDKPGF